MFKKLITMFNSTRLLNDEEPTILAQEVQEFQEVDIPNPALFHVKSLDYDIQPIVDYLKNTPVKNCSSYLRDMGKTYTLEYEDRIITYDHFLSPYAPSVGSRPTVHSLDTISLCSSTYGKEFSGKILVSDVGRAKFEEILGIFESIIEKFESANRIKELQKIVAFFE